MYRAILFSRENRMVFTAIAACECYPNLNANIVMIRQYRQVEPIELVMITGESVLPAC